MFRAFPSILIAVLLYNVVAFGGLASGHPDIQGLLAQNFDLKMVSGDVWKIGLGDMFVTLALLMLFVEVIKASRASPREIVNHALSLLTFIGALAEFILLKGFATSVFFFIAAMCLFDAVAGYGIARVAARQAAPVALPEPDGDY